MNFNGPETNSGCGSKLSLGCLAALVLSCGGIALLAPSTVHPRAEQHRLSCSNNLKAIGLAMHNYHDTYGVLPPAYTVDDQGRPLHSWRTLILPFLDQHPLYDQIDLDQPWDAPVNQSIAATELKCFGCPASSNLKVTTYVAVVDPSEIMSGSEGTAFRDITDGASNTMLVVEVDESHSVPWMSPRDIDLPTFLGFAGQDKASHHPGGAHLVIADGSVRFLANSLDAAIRRALVTKAGGETVRLP